MIYEIRTSDLKTNMVSEYVRRVAEKIPGRTEFSKLGGHWYTEAGPLNQVIAIWPYESADQRTRIREEAEASGKWPPDTGDLVITVTSGIYRPAPFMRPLVEGKMGPIYELRIYTYPDSPPKIVGMAFVVLQQVWGVNRGVDRTLRGVSERIGNG